MKGITVFSRLLSLKKETPFESSQSGEGIKSLKTSGVFRTLNFELYVRPNKMVMAFVNKLFYILQLYTNMEAKLKKYLDAWDTVGAREMFQKKLDRKEMDEVAWDLISLISTYITDEINTKCPILIATCSDLLEIVVEFSLLLKCITCPLKKKSDRLLLENDPEVIKRLKTVESFTEVILNPIMKVLHTDPEIKDEISTFILNIFHKPIIYLNLHVEEEKNLRVKSFDCFQNPIKSSF
ncbi:unnamed protein product [Lepeophtheirus salmonis]|uniref:Small integral membrane protein 8 n=1 Tax=Lepeophtheirus salmonis TaxID=72036 RepID=A0A7R8CTR7_LEPSM|nr:unnamed protein product [Lepeophtheirus salmonis]CAF2876006.1 unnamed protein product [Lepeophtheirus salmonis]